MICASLQCQFRVQSRERYLKFSQNGWMSISNRVFQLCKSVFNFISASKMLYKSNASMKQQTNLKLSRNSYLPMFHSNLIFLQKSIECKTAVIHIRIRITNLRNPLLWRTSYDRDIFLFNGDNRIRNKIQLLTGVLPGLATEALNHPQKIENVTEHRNSNYESESPYWIDIDGLSHFSKKP